MTGNAAELARRGVEHRPTRPAHPAPTSRVLGRRRHRPVRDEPAEVVDPRDVEQRERPPQALGPPAIARALQRRPVVQGVAPELAEVRERVRRHARDLPGAKQRRPRAVVGPVGSDVDRHVADQPDPALVGVLPQRTPLAREAHLIGHRAPATREALPVADPERLALAEVRDLVVANLRRRLREQASPGGERRRGLVRGPCAVRRPERQHLPPRLAGTLEPVDEAEGVIAKRSGRERRRMQLHARCSGLKKVHVTKRLERRE